MTIYKQSSDFKQSHYHSLKDIQLKKLNQQIRLIDKGVIDTPQTYRVYIKEFIVNDKLIKSGSYNVDSYDQAIKLFNKCKKAVIYNSYNEVIAKK